MKGVTIISSDSHTRNAVTLGKKTHNELDQNDRTRCNARQEAGSESLGNFKDDKGPAKCKFYDVASGTTLKRILAVSVFLVLLSVVTNLLATMVALWYMEALRVGELKRSSEPTNTVLNEMLQVSSQPILVDRQTEQPVATTAVTFQMNLLNSPSAPFPEPADFDYSTITTLSLTLEDESGPSGFTVMGYKYYNSTDMDFYLTVGYTVHFSRAQGVKQGVLVPGVHIGGDDDARNRRLSSRQLWGAPVVVGGGARIATALGRGIYRAGSYCAPRQGCGITDAWETYRNIQDALPRRSPPPPRSRFG